MVDQEQSRVARRTFVRRLSLAGGGLALAGTGACGQAPSGAVAGAAAGAFSEAAPAEADAPTFELYHEEHGEGPAVVFAHGAGGTHMSWWNQIPTFSREFRCITYSQRGFGFSPDVPGGPGRAAFAEDLRGLLDRLGIERVSLVGQSMGGRSVLGFAAVYPERVDALVMSSTTGGYTDDDLTALRESAPDLGERSAFSAAYAERDPEGAFLYRSVSSTNRRLSPEETAATNVDNPDISRISGAGVRTLFIVGELDTVAMPTVIKGLQAKMPGSSLVTFDDSGHSPYWEIPDRFNEAVLEFLRG